MHIHGQIPAVQRGDYYGINGNQRSPESRRGAESRRRLRASAKNVPGNLSLEEMELIDQWTSSADLRRSTAHPDPDFF
jgi:hypothetical protein